MSIQAEEWRPVVGFEGRYEVSSLGRIRSFAGVGRNSTWGPHNKPKILSSWLSGSGYPTIHLGGRRDQRKASIHTLVAEAFIPNPHQEKEVNHIDGDKLNNVVANLEWVSRKANMRHAVATGLVAQGSAHHNARHTEKEAWMVVGALLCGNSYTEIEKALGVNRGLIKAIAKGRSGYLGPIQA